jgi:hypothetical protein
VVVSKAQVWGVPLNLDSVKGFSRISSRNVGSPHVKPKGKATEDQYHKAAMKRAGALGVLTKGKQGVDELCREIEKAAAMMSFISQARKQTALLN